MLHHHEQISLAVRQLWTVQEVTQQFEFTPSASESSPFGILLLLGVFALLTPTNHYGASSA